MRRAAGSLESLRDLMPAFTVFIGTTRTSTIPGITIAGPSPEATLYTPALDVEYLVIGRPVTLNVIPVTPDGIPTPALLSRAALGALKIPVIIVETGSHIKPKIPLVALPSATPGEAINSGRALPRGTARALFEEARLLGLMLGGSLDFVVGESIPAGTTTAMAIMEALGIAAKGRVSSSGPSNPHRLKEMVVNEGIAKAGIERGKSDVFDVIDAVGDPVHISVAGFVAGAVERGSRIVLAGGTQMCSVLAILKRLNVNTSKLIVATTRWIVEDSSSDMLGLVKEISPETQVVASTVSFEGSAYRGLRAYEQGYVKEGVGAGGLLSLLQARGFDEKAIREIVEKEYERLVRGGLSI